MSTTAPLPLPTTANIQQDVRAPETPFKFDDENCTFKALITAHQAEIDKCTLRREYRKHRVNVKEKRERKELLADETIIPDRTIDQNIRSEKVPYIRYIEQTATVLAFHDPAAPTLNFEGLSDWTTMLFRHGHWKLPWFKLIDTILTHGGGSVELIFNDKAPGKAVVEFIRRENLILPQRARSIDSCLRIGREYELTKHQFSTLARELSFNDKVTAKINDIYKNRDEFIKIYKLYGRDKSGIVYNFWLAPENIGADDYLRAPTVHFSGELSSAEPDPLTGLPQPPNPIPATKYPIYFFPYHVEEDETLLEIQGRAALDLHCQEARTSLLSATVNGATRASRFYPTRKLSAPGDTPSNDSLFVLKHGHVFEGEFDIFQPNWPNTIALSIDQALATRKAQEIGQTDFAAMNRQDTAKTATELVQAQQTAESLNSVNISLFAEICLELYLDWWNIILSQALAGAVPIPPELADPAVLSSPSLTATMAADAQVVKRAQRAQQYAQYFPAVANSPYALPFLESMLKELFPQEFAQWKQAADAANQTTQLLGQAGEALMNVPAEAIPVEQHEQYKQLLNGIQAATGASPAAAPAMA